MSRATKMIFTFFISAMVWLGLFIATDSGAEFLKIHNIIIGIPSYCLISFGCYALYEIGKGLSNLQDREEEYSNVLNDIKKAKEFLSSKGFFEKDHETHRKRIDDIVASRKKKIKDPVLLEHIKQVHQAKEQSRRMIQTEKNYDINRKNQMLFEKIIEISQGKNNDSNDLGRTSASRRKIVDSVSENVEPTLHYFFRKKQAEKIAEENESMAKRIIHQPPTLKRTKVNKEILNYLEVRFQMQKFKNYFAEPPKKRKFKKRKIILSPINAETKARDTSEKKENNLPKKNDNEMIKIEEKQIENTEKKEELTENKEKPQENVDNSTENKENQKIPEKPLEEEKKEIKSEEEKKEIKPEEEKNETKPEEGEKKEEKHEEPKVEEETITKNNDSPSKTEEKTNKPEETEPKVENSINKNTSGINESNVNSSAKVYGILIVSPKNAELISSGELSSEMQTLVRIKLWDQKVRTKVSRNKGKTPIWNQNLTVERHTQSKNKNMAIIEIWQNDEWSAANKFFGSGLLNIDDLEIFGENKKTSSWLSLMNEDKNVGRVLIAFEWKAQEKKMPGLNNSHSEQRLKQSKEKLERGAFNKQIIMNSKKSGLLIVKPKQAEMYSEFALPNDMDAYIRAIMGKEMTQSSVSLSKGEKLQWAQSLNLKRKASETDLILELWFKDNFSGNDFKGRMNLDLLKTNVFFENKSEHWLEIKNEEQKIVGKLFVNLEWKVISIKKRDN